MGRIQIAVAGIAVAAWALMLGAPPLTLAGNGETQQNNNTLRIEIAANLKTAIYHSGELAQKVNTLDGVQLHLHHVLNCLDGPDGAYFVGQAGYPCQGQGIIPDLNVAELQNFPGAQSAMKEARTAEMLAVQALNGRDVVAVQQMTLVISKHLQNAAKYAGE